MFPEERTYIIGILNTICKKLSFPKKLLDNLKKSGLKELSDQMELYNKNILQAIKYRQQLLNMTKWGFFLNSYRAWIFSTNKIIKYYNSCRNNILNLSTRKNTKNNFENVLRNKILSQSYVESKKLDMYMHIQKNEFKYTINYFDEDVCLFALKTIEYTDILKLLPVCYIVEINKPLFNFSNPIEFLDPIDIISNE